MQCYLPADEQVLPTPDKNIDGNSGDTRCSLLGELVELNRIKVALVYSSGATSLSGNLPNKTHSYFFKHALFRNKNLDIDYFNALAQIDVSTLAREYDVVLLPLIDVATSLALADIRDYNIPVIARSHDPHTVLKRDMVGLATDLKVDWFFDQYAPASFYEYYPAHFKYETVHLGLEPSLYENIRPWAERVSDKIAISGVLGYNDLKRKIYHRVILRIPKPLTRGFHYKLRTKCNTLPYVIHTRDIYPEQGTNELPALLSMFKTAIAATTSFPTVKYKETPAAGCLTFMEVTDQNHGLHLGYEDGKSAVFIDKSNYVKKFQEYLDDPNDPRWERIARAGRKHALENLSNDNGVDKLVSMMRKALGE